MSNNNKVKGLLKGLRFISQIFDNEKDQEIEIGNPTDVKHVAHIGWEGHGPSENAPSWMNEFQSVPGNQPVSQNRNGEKGHDNSVKQVSKGQEKDMPDHLPKPSSKQRHSHSTSNHIRECHGKEKCDRPRNQRKHSKHSQHSNDSSFNESNKSMERDSDSLQLSNGELPPKNPSENHKKSRPKTTKDGSNASGGPSKSRSSKAQSNDSHNQGHRSRSSSKSGNKHDHFEEDHGQVHHESRDENERLRNYN